MWLMMLELSLWEYPVLRARDADEAVTVARAGRPDVVLFDILWGSSWGHRFEVLARLRTEPAIAEVPVIVTKLQKEENGCIGAPPGLGDVDYLAKDGPAEEVHAALEGLLKTWTAARDARAKKSRDAGIKAKPKGEKVFLLTALGTVQLARFYRPVVISEPDARRLGLLLPDGSMASPERLKALFEHLVESGRECEVVDDPKGKAFERDERAYELVEDDGKSYRWIWSDLGEPDDLTETLPDDIGGDHRFFGLPGGWEGNDFEGSLYAVKQDEKSGWSVHVSLSDDNSWDVCFWDQNKRLAMVPGGKRHPAVPSHLMPSRIELRSILSVLAQGKGETLESIAQSSYAEEPEDETIAGLPARWSGSLRALHAVARRGGDDGFIWVEANGTWSVVEGDGLDRDPSLPLVLACLANHLGIDPASLRQAEP
jgi:CheY-like chemotaxis protein